MLPGAILNGKLWMNDRGDPPVSIRVLELSVDHFTFRLSKQYPCDLHAEEIVLLFYRFEPAKYEEVVLSKEEMQISVLEKQSFYQVYRVEVNSEDYRHRARELMGAYTRYIRLKLEEDDSTLSAEMAGYPAEKDECFADSFQDWKDKMMDAARERYLNENHSFEWIGKSRRKLAIELSDEMLQKKFLELDKCSFQNYLWEDQRASWHPISKLPIEGIYVGSQYCLHCFPEIETLYRIINKAKEYHWFVVIMFPPIRGELWEKAAYLLHCVTERILPNKDKNIEILCNDWGLIRFIKEEFGDAFPINIGIHLNKRRKDVRMNGYLGERGKLYSEQLNKNSANADFFGEYLKKEWMITRYSYEACSYSYEAAEGRHTLHFPYFQMNTSGNCTLRAYDENKDRGMQAAGLFCPRPCRDRVFLYPTHLQMIGLGNSLLGFDDRSLWDSKYMEELCKSGIDRIVWTTVG